MEEFRNKKILLVVAHPDDELLGPGASMNRLLFEYGVTIHVVILGEGITSRSHKREKEKWVNELKQHKANIYSAQKAIGYQSVSIYDFPDNRFDSVPLLDIIKIVEKEKADFNPSIVFTHHGGDLNVDHQATFSAVMTACRPMREEAVKTIITFETPSGTEWQASSNPNRFIPNLFISVSSENMQAKINGMESYEFERRDFPHPRSPKALEIQAQRWGVSVGEQYAEAFSVIRRIT